MSIAGVIPGVLRKNACHSVVIETLLCGIFVKDFFKKEACFYFQRSSGV